MRISAAPLLSSRSVRNPFIRIAAVLGAVLLVVAGCSKINTDLEVSPDLSGQRTMVVSISESDFSSHVSGTADEVAATITSALPTELTATPFTLSEGSYETTIVLSFSSPDDYVAKVQSVLDAGDVDLDAEVAMSVADSPFSQGVVIEENFNSEDLLEWMRTALVDGGLVDSSDASSMFEFGTTTVTYDGDTESTYPTISFDNREDGGMSEVLMTTTYEGDGTWARTIYFEMSGYVYEQQSDTVEQFFSENLPTGAVMSRIDDSSYSATWSVDIPASSPEDLEAAMNKLFATEDSKFRVDQGTPAVGIPATIVTLVDNVDCSQLCSYPDASIEDQITLPASWSAEEATLGSSWVESDGDEQILYTSADGTPIEFVEYLPLQKVDVDLAVAASGALDLELTFGVDAEVASANSELFEEVFEGGLTDAAISLEESSDGWEYTIRLEAPNAIEMNALLSAYAPGSEIVFLDEGSAFAEDYMGALTLHLTSIVGSAEITEGVDYKVSLPFLHSFKTERRLQSECYEDWLGLSVAEEWCDAAAHGDPVVESGAGLSERDATLAFAASGLSLLSMILIASLVGLLIIGGIVLFLMRKKIAAKREERKEKKALALAAAPAAPPAVTQEYPELPLAAPPAPPAFEMRDDDELY